MQVKIIEEKIRRNRRWTEMERNAIDMFLETIDSKRNNPELWICSSYSTVIDTKYLWLTNS
jgi:hypothetical protein